MILTIILAIENEDDRILMLRIYQECYPLMKSKAYAVVKDLSIAEDIVQDAIIKLIDRLPSIRSLNKPQMVSYICKTVNSIAIDHYRKNHGNNSKIIISQYDDITDDIRDESQSPAERYETIDEYEKLGEALLKLSERDKDLLFYKYYLEYSDKQISNLMGIESTNVRVSLNRARKRVKAILCKAGDYENA